MKEHVDNYKEARVIIKNSVKDEYTKHTTKVAGVRALLASVVGLGAIVGAGIATGSAVISAGLVVPVCGLVGIPFMMPWLVQKSANSKVQTGEYFRGKSEEEIIEIANSYVDKNNEFEASRSK